MAVFNRVEMYVIHVPFPIFLVADAVFPETPLPYGPLTLGCS
jgi:hypothetical protein